MKVTMPETQYAVSGEANIAYQVFGEGDRNVVMIPGAFSHLELTWDSPAAVELFERLAGSTRFAIFDKRGTGLSDRNVGIAPLEVRMDDARAVMDACGMESASILGISEGGPMSLLLAATYPERVESLVVYGSAPTWRDRPDVPGSDRAQQYARDILAAIEAGFAQGNGFEYFAGPDFDEPEVRREVARRWRNSASPADAVQIFKMLAGIDVCDILPLVSCPTLVIATSEDTIAPAESCRWMAEQIPHGRYEELPGYHYCVFDSDINARYVALIEEFVTGTKTATPTSRALATVLFTDIVASTDTATRIGDRKWRELLEQHDHRSEQVVSEHGGLLVKSTGDGILATFDGPGRAVSCAHALLDAGRSLGIELRAGIHTGEIELRHDGDVSGIAVHLASRVESQAQAGEVLVSRTVTDLTIGSGLTFASRGEHQLKGIPGTWELFAAQL